MTARSLHASINGSQVGTLAEENGVWSFEYAGSWLSVAGRYPLSSSLPLQGPRIIDGSTQRPVQWFFDNLLPEEGQRLLLSKSAKIREADAFGLLEHYGAESAGALTLLKPGDPESTEGTLKKLSDRSLSRRIQDLPNVPLTQKAGKRMSLAGAQHKLAVVIEGGALYEPVGARASTHILKPNHPDEDYPHSVINEWFSMRLAKAMGLDVPAVEKRYVPEPVYLIERFDRERVDGHWQRLHAIDACQLLNLDRSYKYIQGSIETLAKLAVSCRGPAVVRTKLFQWLVFNVLIGNSDAHLKNLSFQVSASGVSLAPHYDLLATGLYESRLYQQKNWPDRTELAWPILEAQRFSELSFDGLREAGHALGLQKPAAERQIRQQRDKIADAALALYEKTLEEDPVPAQAEQRCVRGIVHSVIKPMVKQLS
ncbi:MAG: HipA domain-containing protein [Hyphomicrobium sp.]|jgi:serine/threonine-protein kinase HipA|uniref:HipA domain-containing protein n=1 Tax=Hyphomicrobium sp. TaxID=82 RepID=UPI0025C307A6|nr:HipA domain-containing protein [Hyphomicrobium sp.]MBX9864992.1 HipA domain-containing protein [Hyphomicrobium sp.]